MTVEIILNLATEDQLSDAVLRRILSEFGNRYRIGNSYFRGGFGYLKKNARSFNNASRNTPFLLLTDLDKATCVPELIASWLPDRKHPSFLFRVAVREVESWILADRRGFARFLGVAENIVPRGPDHLRDAKASLIAVARRSRKRDLRSAIVPADRTSARQGPDYNGVLVEFVFQHWNLLDAGMESPSLKRTMDRLREFTPV